MSSVSHAKPHRGCWSYSRVERLVELVSLTNGARETLYRRLCDREMIRAEFDRRSGILERRFRRLSDLARTARRNDRLDRRAAESAAVDCMGRGLIPRDLAESIMGRSLIGHDC